MQKIGTAGAKEPSVLGAGIVLKVMAGDVVSAHVMWYEQMQGNNAPETVDPLLAQLMNAMAGGIVGTGVRVVCLPHRKVMCWQMGGSLFWRRRRTIGLMLRT